MAWDEWEQLKAEVAQRHSMRMELNDAAPGRSAGAANAPDSGGSGTLQHTDQPWNHAAAVAGDLDTGMGNAKRDLDTAVTAASSGLQGLSSVDALRTIHRSWDDRLSAIQRECQALQPALSNVSRTLGETDGAVGSRVSSVPAPGSWKAS
jgi:hypothetical protein